LKAACEGGNPMKKCSYCGAEYPDEAVVCAVDQTPLDNTYYPEEPAVAPAIKRKIPIRLSIVSYCFFASGVSYLGWFLLAAYLERFLLLNLIVGVLNLFVSRGLRRCSPPWRVCALVLICSAFFKGCFSIHQNFIHHPHLPIVAFIIIWSSSLLILIWFYRVLTRPDIRELFNKE
jgi:hypothetical protein